MKILTISIAAYNVEKYLSETLDTLCDSRYINDIEVLVIDDGSKDHTGEIASSYQKKFPNSIKYVAKENGGHGSTINKGMELATGKYFRILDGDDYVDQEGFFSYIQKLKKCSTDVAITDYWWVDDYHKTYQHNHQAFSKMEDGKEYEYKSDMDSSLYGLSTLTIKTELLKRAAFKITEKCFYVDVEFIVWAIHLSESYTYFKDKVYMYRCISTTQNSVSKANMLKNVKMQEKVALNLCVVFDNFKCDANDEKGKVILRRITMSVGAVYRTYLLMKDNEQILDSIKVFNVKIQERSKDVYKFTNKNLFIRLARNNKCIPFIKFAYSIYQRIKKK